MRGLVDHSGGSISCGRIFLHYAGRSVGWGYCAGRSLRCSTVLAYMVMESESRGLVVLASNDAVAKQYVRSIQCVDT